LLKGGLRPRGGKSDKNRRLRRAEKSRVLRWGRGSVGMSELKRRRKEKGDIISEIWVFCSESCLTSK
jgi:hypothetical protein